MRIDYPSTICQISLLTTVAMKIFKSVKLSLAPQELKFLDGVIQNPQRPLVAIVGGSKVSSKITVLESLIQKVDKLILGYHPVVYY